MSTFDGVIKEYPLISIDSFLAGRNYASTTYFLSHCHSDHMRGLKHASFFSLLESRSFSKIYVSDVTSHLLKNDDRHQHLSDYLEVLPMEQPTIIMLYDKKGNMCSTVTVTLLTAGHCPGSVMFLIEGDNGRVLYTGDFRLPVGSAVRLKNLYENDHLKPLRSLYIDTTFCKGHCLYIPSREECLEEIVSLVKGWLDKGPNYIIYFFCRYDFGYEFVFVELYQRFNVKTHISEYLLRKYKGIKHLEDAFTSCPSEARIHSCVRDEKFVCDSYKGETFCGYTSPNGENIKVRKIKPTAIFFTNKALSIVSVYLKEINLHRVYYSAHSSLSEIRDLVHNLKPEQVFPNVIFEQTEEEILDLIFPSTVQTSAEIDLQNPSLSPLGKLKSPCRKDHSSNEIDSLPFFDECYQITQGQKIAKSQSKGTNYASGLNENPCVDTDYENTEEQETMLKEEIYSQIVVSKNPATPIESPLKWENPIISSDEEVFVSSPESSLSDVGCGTSEEQDIKDSNVEEKIASTPESSMTSSAKSSVSVSLMNDYTSDQASFKCDIDNGAMRFDKSPMDIDKELAELAHIDNGKGNNEANLKLDASVSEVAGSYFKSKDNLQILSTTSKLSSNFQSTSNGDISSNLDVPNSGVGTFKMVEKVVDDIKDSIVNDRTGESAASVDENKSDFTCKNRESLMNMKSLNSAVNCNAFKPESTISHYKLDCDSNKLLNNFAFTSEKSNFCAKNKKSKSFRYVKKINSHSESEDEYTFKYVVKLGKEQKSLNDKKQGLNSDTTKTINLISNQNPNVQSKNNNLYLKKELGYDGQSNSRVNGNSGGKNNLKSCSNNSNNTKHFDDVKCHISSLESNSAKKICNGEENNCFTSPRNLNNMSKIEHESSCVVAKDGVQKTSNSSQSKICNRKSLDVTELKPCNSIVKTPQDGETHFNSFAPKQNSSNSFNKQDVGYGSLINNSTSANSCSIERDKSCPLLSGRNVIKSIQNKTVAFQPLEKADMVLLSNLNKKKIAIAYETQNAITSVKRQVISNGSLHNSSTLGNLSKKPDEASLLSFYDQNATKSIHKQSTAFKSSDNASTAAKYFSYKPNNLTPLFPVNQNDINSIKKQDITISNNSPPDNPFSHTQNSTSALVSGNSNAVKVPVINYATGNAELIDLSSDHSDDEVSIIDPLIVAKYESASSHKNSFPSTSFENRSYKTENIRPMVGCITKAPCRTPGASQRMSEKRLSDIENLSKIQNRNFQSKSMINDDLNSNIRYNSLQQELGESPEIVLERNINLKTNDQFHSSQNKAMLDVWEIKSVGRSTPSSKITVEGNNSSSDLDDSPSLIAPIVSMSCSNRTSVGSKSLDDSKRRKIESQNKGASKVGVCDKVRDLFCDNIMMDSDNTPDDLDTNCDLLSNNDFKIKSYKSEIVIDD